MAYDLVAALENQHQTVILNQLKEWVNKTQQSDNKQHEVFEPSFDWKPAWRQTGNAGRKNLLYKN